MILMRIKRRGLTLVELLIAVLLGAVVVLVTTGVTRQVTLIMERMSSRTLAWERGQNALSIIEPRALHAGFGLTYDRAGDFFRRSFGKNDTSWPPPARWIDRRGPLQIWDGQTSYLSLAPDNGGVFRGRGMSVLYAVPSALRAGTSMDISMNAGDSAKIRLIPSEELVGIATGLPTAAKNDLRSWVTFPLMRMPVHAVYLAGELTVRMADDSGRSATLHPFDEMHYIRAARFYVQDEVMYSEELRTSWTNIETRLEGVLEMWFEWTPSKKLLEAWILTTGGRSFRRTAKPGDWPSEAPWRDEFENHDVVVTKGSWFLKNM